MLYALQYAWTLDLVNGVGRGEEVPMVWRQVCRGSYSGEGDGNTYETTLAGGAGGQEECRLKYKTTSCQLSTG